MGIKKIFFFKNYFILLFSCLFINFKNKGIKKKIIYIKYLKYLEKTNFIFIFIFFFFFFFFFKIYIIIKY